MENFEEKVLTTLSAGVLIWLFTGAYRFLYQRSCLGHAIKQDIRALSSGCREYKKFFTIFARKNLAEGEPISYSARFSKQELSLFRSLQKEIFSYFPRLYSRIDMYYSAFAELETLIENFFEEVTIWKNRERVLAEEDRLYLLGKIGRIVGLADALGEQSGASLAKLTVQYSSRIPADQMLEIVNGIASRESLPEVASVILLPESEDNKERYPPGNSPSGGAG